MAAAAMAAAQIHCALPATQSHLISICSASHTCGLLVFKLLSTTAAGMGVAASHAAMAASSAALSSLPSAVQNITCMHTLEP